MSIPLIAAGLKSAFAAIGSAGAGIGSALSVGTTGLSFLQAKGQADAQEKLTAQANDRARQYMIEDIDQTTRMADQERAAATQRLDQNQIDARKAAASAQVSATAGGVSGLSVDALLGDIWGQEAGIRDSVNQNLENTGRQINAERTSIGRQFQDTVSSRAPVNKPSLIGAGFEAATGVYGAYKDNLRVKSKLTSKG